jgi:hypothetical protein
MTTTSPGSIRLALTAAKRVLLGVEDAGRPAVLGAVDGQLDHAAVRREVAAQDPHRPALLDRPARWS